MACVGLPRWVEALAAAVGIVVVSPLLLVAAVLVKATSRGPVFFRQKRLGRLGRPFELVKLRTMRVQMPGTAITAGGDVRVTSVGRLLRKTKLDELPELWNVLTGEMGIVGPRPEVPSMVDLSDPVWRLVLSARPGLTDPVTLALRNEESLLAEARAKLGNVESFYRERLQPWKLRGYVQYLGNRSAWSDLKVLWKTVVSVAGGAAVRPPSLQEILEVRATPSAPEAHG